MSALPAIPAKAERLAECEAVIERGLAGMARERRLRRTSPVRPRQTDVYLCYAADGDLLYVGISLSVASRLGQHRHGGWWARVARVEVEHHPDRDTALVREQELIWDRHPRHNVAGVR